MCTHTPSFVHPTVDAGSCPCSECRESGCCEHGVQTPARSPASSSFGLPGLAAVLCLTLRTLEPGFPHAASLGAPHRHSLSILLTAAPGGSGVGVGAKWCLAVVSTCVALATEESQRAVLTFTGEPGIFPDVTAAAVGEGVSRGVGWRAVGLCHFYTRGGFF